MLMNGRTIPRGARAAPIPSLASRSISIILFRRPFRCRHLLAFLGMCMAASVAQAADAAYPNRPVRLVVGFTPGGATDALARLIAPKLAESMGQPWIVDNRGGAGGNLGTEAVVRAAPDGYTVLFALDTQLTANPSLYKLPFNVQTGLRPVTMVAKFENVLVVNSALPAQNLQEFVASAKRDPDVLNYGSSGIGSTLHLASEMFKSRTGIEMRHVPYKGAAPALAAIVGGEIQAMVGAIPSTMPHIKSGKLRALATTGAKRNALTPDLPTVAESGYPGFESIGWFALMVPVGTPKDVVDRIRNETLKVLEDSDVRATMSTRGLDVQPSTPEELTLRIQAETAAVAEIIRKVGIRPE